MPNLEYKVLTNKHLLQSITGIIFIVLPYLEKEFPPPHTKKIGFTTMLHQHSLYIRTACLAKY